MNTKMKESKNLKALKSNMLVGLYLDKINHEGQLSECLFGLASQTHPVDVVILDGGLSDLELETLIKISQNPSIKTLGTDENGNPDEKIIEAGVPLVLNIIKTSVSNFSKIFNDIFNLAVDGGYNSMSIIEVEDTVGSNWYSIADKYMLENEDVGFFLPMIRSFKNGMLLGLVNEACWADGMAEEAGKFDMNLLLRINCANPLGAIYKIESLKEFSEEKDDRFYPMKESIKISHYYEFFLRMIYNDIKIMSIPRMGYDMRASDLSEFNHSSSKVPQNLISIPKEKGGIDSNEYSFWAELAKKEYFFDEDRCKTFSPTL